MEKIEEIPDIEREDGSRNFVLHSFYQRINHLKKKSQCSVSRRLKLTSVKTCSFKLLKLSSYIMCECVQRFEGVFLCVFFFFCLIRFDDLK